MADKNPLN